MEKDLLQVATSPEMLGTVGGIIGENLIEKAAFKALPQVFGVAVPDANGRITFHGVKPNPDPVQRGAIPFVPQTAESPQLGWNRQIMRVAMGAACLYLGMTSNNDGLRTSLFAVAGTAGAHLVQDFFPPLRG